MFAAGRRNLFDRIRFEKKTIEAMTLIYCRDFHHTGELCNNCKELLNYAFNRVDNCPFLPMKPVCSNCLVHCYRKSMAVRVKEVMRYAGPRMLRYHPIKALVYLYLKKTIPGRILPPKLVA